MATPAQSAANDRRGSAGGSDVRIRQDNSGCALYELVQYHCYPRIDHVVCEPIERILRRCPGRPAVDVTHVVKTDAVGNIYLPAHLRDAMPPAKHWSEIE